MKTHFSSNERIEANRAQLFAWAVSQWFVKQGIRRKAAK